MEAKGWLVPASVYATTVRLDEGFTPDAEIVWDGREEAEVMQQTECQEHEHHGSLEVCPECHLVGLLEARDAAEVPVVQKLEGHWQEEVKKFSRSAR